MSSSKYSKCIIVEIIKSFSVWIQQLLAITKSSLEEKEFTETYLEDVDQDFTGERFVCTSLFFVLFAKSLKFSKQVLKRVYSPNN